MSVVSLHYSTRNQKQKNIHEYKWKKLKQTPVPT